MTNQIIFTDISKSYPGTPKKWALKNLSFSVVEGEFFCLVGPSGCGKSTILKIVAGIEQPTAGQLQRPDSVGMVFQSGALLPWLTVEENVAFGLKMTNLSTAEANQITRSYIELVELGNFAKKYPRELSGGQRQRVGIARALAIQPKVLLLDEPFSALDPITTKILHDDLLKIWQQTKITILMVSHLIEEAVLLADRIGVMTYGQLIRIEDNLPPRPRDESSPQFTATVKKIKDSFN